MQRVYRLEFPLTPTHQGRGRKKALSPRRMLNPFSNTGPLPPPWGRARERGEYGLADNFLMQFDAEML